MNEPVKLPRSKRWSHMGIAAACLAIAMAVSSPMQAFAASSVLWDGNSQKGTWVSGRTDYSTKINVTSQAPGYTSRVGIRVNGSVTNGTVAATVTYKKKTNPSLWCRWDQGLGQVIKIRCTNYW